MRFRIAVIFLTLIAMFSGNLIAQDADAPAGTAKAEFDEVFTTWKANLQELRDLYEKYNVEDDDQLDEIRAQFKSKFAETDALVAKFRETALAAYIESPNRDRSLTRALISMARVAVEKDQYAIAKPIADALTANGCDEKGLFDIAGTIAFATDDFEKAEEYLTEADELGVLGLGKNYLGSVSEMKELWEKEKEIRKAEAAADDLPRVKLTTNKGDIVLELYENEAPDTVGNFISLVKRGYYDGLTFHRVLPGFMAQGGDPDGDGSGGPGYNIYCECYQENYRRHFSGTLSMAKSVPRDTGGSQFFLTFVATPHLNGKHTAFGRVIEGMDVLQSLQRINPDDAESGSVEPDKIETAEVIRARDHEYVPNKV
ncbi:peptidylprolyl isomerase [Planctomycetota bacterium]